MSQDIPDGLEPAFMVRAVVVFGLGRVVGRCRGRSRHGTYRKSPCELAREGMFGELSDNGGERQDRVDLGARTRQLGAALLQEVEHRSVVGADDRVKGDKAVVMGGDDQRIEE